VHTREIVAKKLQEARATKVALEAQQEELFDKLCIVYLEMKRVNIDLHLWEARHKEQEAASEAQGLL